jgi:tetratricopeptide (TPR) repeat protein
VLGDLGQPLPTSRAGWAPGVVRGLVGQVWRRWGLGRSERRDERRQDLAAAAEAASLITHHFFYTNDAVAMVASSLLSVNLAERAGCPERVPRSYSLLALVAGLIGRRKLAESYLGRARSGAESIHDPAERAFAFIVEAVYHASFGEWPAAERAVTEGLASLEGVHAPAEHELAQTMLGHIEYYTGRLEASRARYAEVLRAAKKSGSQQHATWGLFSMGRSLVQLGRFDEAAALLDEARANLAQKPELQSEIICLGLSALAQHRRGEPELAERLAAETLARISRSRPTGFPAIDGYAGAAMVFLELWKSAPEHAEHRQRALALVTAMDKFARQFPMARPTALVYRGLCDLERGAPRKASRAFVAAQARAKELGMPREEARALFGRALAAPDAATRGPLFDEAEAIFQRIGCAYHVGLVARKRAEGS